MRSSVIDLRITAIAAFQGAACPATLASSGSNDFAVRALWNRSRYGTAVSVTPRDQVKGHPAAMRIQEKIKASDEKERSGMVSPRIVCVLALLLAVSCLPATGQIGYLNLSMIQPNGSATPVNPEGGSPYLSLTQDTFQYQSGSGWYFSDQSVSAGFTSVFQFQITHSGFPADGIAFVIQNCASCDGQTS